MSVTFPPAAMPAPILFVGDAPDLRTGLGRIGRDLAVRLALKCPEFRVGYLGRGGLGSTQLPFAQYNFPEDSWGQPYIEKAWTDFARGERGVVFTIWDATRLAWFSGPDRAKQLPPWLARFLAAGDFERWGYFPIDGVRRDGRLPAASAYTMAGYDRVLAYSLYGLSAMGASGITSNVDWAPHGYDPETFCPRDRAAARMAIGFNPDQFVVGVVMTNQLRKDWGVAVEAAACLAKQKRKFRLWLHVDHLTRYWDIVGLVDASGLAQVTKITQAGALDDVQMSFYYSACDVTMLPTLGEGWGYPLVESLACGVPVVTTRCTTAPEILGDWSDMLAVEADTWRTEHVLGVTRPVVTGERFAEHVLKVGKALKEEEGPSVQECVRQVEHLQWPKLWPTWEKWFKSGGSRGGLQ